MNKKGIKTVKTPNTILKYIFHLIPKYKSTAYSTAFCSLLRKLYFSSAAFSKS